MTHEVAVINLHEDSADIQATISRPDNSSFRPFISHCERRGFRRMLMCRREDSIAPDVHVAWLAKLDTSYVPRL
ncbi:hypothetical protein J6590_022579 [Homalodisca vitripennis]|nr:hypothetical protein J6590_022579 [Homalodisca vitripennis]